MREWRGTIVQALVILSLAVLGFRDVQHAHDVIMILGAVAGNAVARGRLDALAGQTMPPPSGGIRIDVPTIPRAPTGMTTPPPANARSMLARFARDPWGAMLAGGAMGALIAHAVG